MKKTLGLITIIILIVIIMIFGYKMILPDGLDSSVEGNNPSSTEVNHGNENLGTEPTVEPTIVPTTESTLVPTSTPTPVVENKDDNDEAENSNATATPELSVTPTVSPSVVPSTTPDDSDEKTEYEKYIELSGEEQQKIFESYENPQDFFEWYNKAKAEYDEKNQAIIVDGGSINLEDYADKQDDKTE